ncbi:hypothetical protein CC79DRAFT_1401848 [Sarocladium strictum]
MMDTTSAYPQLNWAESSTQEGLWQRDTDEIEDAYAGWEIRYEGSTGMFFSMTGHVSLCFPTLKEPAGTESDPVHAAIRKAWTALRYDHPAIASQTMMKPAGGFQKIYHTIKNEDDLRQWLDRTMVFVSGYKTGAEFANSRPPSPPSPTIFVVSAAAGDGKYRRDIVFRSPHSIIDGIGTLMLLNKLITYINEALGSPTFTAPALDGTEVKNLSPPYRVAAGVPPTPTEAMKRRLAESPTASTPDDNSGKKEPKVLSVPYTKGALEPGVPRRIALALSKDETARLRRLCKDANATPTHAFHAAVPMLMRDLQARGESEDVVRYVGYILRNERASCLDPYNTAEHPVTLYHSASRKGLNIDLALPAAGSVAHSRKEEFSRVLSQMRDYYHSVRDDTEHAMLAPYLWKAAAGPCPSFADRPCPVPPPSDAPSVSISSMGEVDRIMPPSREAVEIYEPWVTGEELRSGVGLFLGTYRGELCLSAAYNEAWQGEDAVMEFLEGCKRIVFEGLGM